MVQIICKCIMQSDQVICVLSKSARDNNLLCQLLVRKRAPVFFYCRFLASPSFLINFFSSCKFIPPSKRSYFCIYRMQTAGQGKASKHNPINKCTFRTLLLEEETIY